MKTDRLIGALADESIDVETDIEHRLNKTLLNHRAFNDAAAIYAELGGTAAQPPVARKITLTASVNGVALEFDDHLHFNRYRAATLKSGVYRNLPGIDADKYRRYCKKYEKECLKSGLQKDYWTSRISEKYFGPSAEPGDFFGAGSAAWKLRAWNELIKDCFCAASGIRLCRLSVYDALLVNGRLVPLGKMLNGSSISNVDALKRFVLRKLDSVS